MKGGEEKKRERKIKVQPSLFFISALALIMVKLLQAGGTDRLQKYLLFLLFYVNPDTFFFFALVQIHRTIVPIQLRHACSQERY